MRSSRGISLATVAALIAALAPGPAQVVDDAGRTVRVPARVRRIVSLSPGATEMVCAVGACGLLAAVDDYSNYPPAAAGRPRLGGFATVGVEAILAARPDLVLAAPLHAAGLAPALARRSIPTLIVDPKSADGVAADIRRIAAAVGLPAGGERAARAAEHRVAEVTARCARLRRPTVFVELSPELFTAGRGSLLDDLITRAGGRNIAGSNPAPWPRLSSEQIIALNPDVILLLDDTGATPASVVRRPGWRRIAAVRTGRVLHLPPDSIVRPSPRIGEGLLLLARAMHPELREDGHKDQRP